MTALLPGRASRWWIAGVPVAIALMLGSSGYRVNDFWYAAGQHHETASAKVGDWTDVTWAYSDAHGETERTFSVRFAGWGETSQDTTERGRDVTLPDGIVARSVRLDFRASPDQVMSGCILTLVDDQGREFRLGGVASALGPANPCVPEETPGPSVPIADTQPRGELFVGESPRPSEWSVAPAIALPDDARIVELRLSYDNPDYLAFTVPR